MEVVLGLPARATRPSPVVAAGSAVTIGAFDGVHLGHLALLAELRQRADARGYPTVVVTFDRHPATVVRPESAPLMLTDLDQKLEILDQSGMVDLAVVLTFDAERATEEAGDFVTSMLVGALNARLVAVGENFHFGRQRRGNVALLKDMGSELGFEVVGLNLVSAPAAPGPERPDRAGDAGPERPDRAGDAGPERPVSSTAIRRLLGEGEISAAAELLGRPYEVRGVVGSGDRRGRQLGFPTANIDVPFDVLLPAEGVYAGWYLRPDLSTHQAAISLGRRPTFASEAPGAGSGFAGRPRDLVLEAYLLDFEGDLYGETARLRFLSRLRGQERFDSADDLVAQTERDVEAARRLLPAG